MMAKLLGRKEMKSRECERGNVLFLILIAVALFAALSYAITSSSRSSGGDADSETNLINSSTITQYPAGVRTTMLRMQVSNSVSLDEFEFNTPNEFANCATVGGTLGVNCVFHPDGGGATFAPSAADVVTSGTQTDWIINSANQINLIGRTGATANASAANSAEIIAFLVGVRTGICERLNQQFGIAGIPVETNVDITSRMINADGATPPAFSNVGANKTIGDTVAASALDGQAYGCFSQGGVNVYYHLLAEQ